MKKERTTQKQVGSLVGPYQVFRLVTEVQLPPSSWVESSEFYLVCLQNFGPISGFVAESLAIADAEQWNADFFNRLGPKIQQGRLKSLIADLDEGRRDFLQNAINIAHLDYGSGSENIPSPSNSPTGNASGDLKLKSPRP